MELGNYAMAGLDPNLLEERAKRLSAVTPEQVMQVARKYLTPNNVTDVTLDPLPIANPKQAPAMGGGSSHVR